MRCKLRLRSFSLRTLLIVVGAAAPVTALHCSLPLPSPFPYVPLYAISLVLAGASIGYDVHATRIGMFIGGVVGLLFTCVSLFAVELYGSVAIGDGLADLEIRISSEPSPRVSSVSYTTAFRAAVPHFIRAYSTPEVDFQAVEDLTKPFTVPVPWSIRWSTLGWEYGYGQAYDVLLFRVEYSDGSHTYTVVDVPDLRSSRCVTVDLPNAD